MRLRRMIGPVVAFSILGVVALAFGYEVIGKLADSRPIPRDGWSAGFHAFQAEGFDKVPVQVFAVRSTIKEGLIGVQIKNRSQKQVTAVRFAWFVSDLKGSGTVLAKGEKEGMSVVNLTADAFGEIPVTPVSWDEILRPLVKKGTLRGDYDIWIAVNKVTYDDGSVWTLPQPKNVARAVRKNAHGVEDSAPCANQTCRLNGNAYRCEDGPGELCTNGVTNCLSSICTLKAD
jgi:hypothetical protein